MNLTLRGSDLWQLSTFMTLVSIQFWTIKNSASSIVILHLLSHSHFHGIVLLSQLSHLGVLKLVLLFLSLSLSLSLHLSLSLSLSLSHTHTIFKSLFILLSTSSYLSGLLFSSLSLSLYSDSAWVSFPLYV